MLLQIERIRTGIHGTFGVIVHNNIPFALTLERQWLNNEPHMSCIPAGVYECRRIYSPKFKETFEVNKVDGRTNILFHKGNLDDDTHGCILVGEQFGLLKGSPAVLSSKEGFDEFMQILKNEDHFTLEINDNFSKNNFSKKKEVTTWNGKNWLAKLLRF